MIRVEINDSEFIVNSNISVLEACKYAGVTVSRFCFHETLSVAVNCRMCLVEIVDSPKPIASCVQPIINNMKIFTNTPIVKKAKENILEFLLLNHPLDCPICDQGGECDLQDQTQNFGTANSRFFFGKRSVEDKFCGPLIKTIMTRCIHCTRCVRFYAEVLGTEVLGTLNRGTLTEIGNYVLNEQLSELSGNVIDLCPVGALTSKNYAFKARPWELRTFESIDLSDSLCSNIYLHCKETEILRVTPKISIELNENLISDKARFSFDGASNNRISSPYIKIGKNFQATKWLKLLPILTESVKKGKVILYIDETLDLDSINSLKNIVFLLGKNSLITVVSNSYTNSENIYISWLSDKISSIQQTSKLGLIFSINTKLENALINYKIRKKVLSEDFDSFFLGYTVDTTFPLEYINFNRKNLLLFLEGKLPYVSNTFINYKSPLIFLGDNLTTRGLNVTILIKTLKAINPTSLILNIRSKCSTETLNFLGIHSKKSNNSASNDTISFFLNLESNMTCYKCLANSQQSVWFNTHKSDILQKTNVVIPTSSEFEEEKIFLNMEQRPQKTSKFFKLKTSVKTLKSVFQFLTKSIFNVENNSLTFLNSTFELIGDPFKFQKISKKFSNSIVQLAINSTLLTVSSYPFKNQIEDFYFTGLNSKNSKVMQKCSTFSRKKNTVFNSK